MTGLVGQSIRRLEDPRFLTGRGRYMADIATPGALYLYVVRSPHAHAWMQRIDMEAARARPAVAGVFTAADLAGLGPIPGMVQVPTEGPMIVPPRPALATDRVRYVGEPVAFVVADTAFGASGHAADLRTGVAGAAIASDDRDITACCARRCGNPPRGLEPNPTPSAN